MSEQYRPIRVWDTEEHQQNLDKEKRVMRAETLNKDLILPLLAKSSHQFGEEKLKFSIETLMFVIYRDI